MCVLCSVLCLVFVVCVCRLGFVWLRCVVPCLLADVCPMHVCCLVRVVWCLLLVCCLLWLFRFSGLSVVCCLSVVRISCCVVGCVLCVVCLSVFLARCVLVDVCCFLGCCCLLCVAFSLLVCVFTF